MEGGWNGKVICPELGSRAGIGVGISAPLGGGSTWAGTWGMVFANKNT